MGQGVMAVSVRELKAFPRKPWGHSLCGGDAASAGGAGAFAVVWPMTREELDDLTIGAVIVHTKTTHLYDYRGLAKHKDPATREWVPVVIYRSMLGDRETYTREVEDFLADFHIMRVGLPT